MAENGNIPSQTHLSDYEMEIIDQITITLAIVLDNRIKDLQDPEQVMKEYADINSSLANITRAFTATILENINQEKGAYQSQIKKDLIEMSMGLYRKSMEDFLANSPNLSKVLKEFEDAGIIFTITGKKEIRDKSPKSIPRKPKVETYEKEKLVGPPVVKKLTSKPEEYVKIISNPQALDIINKRLIKYGKIEKAYNLIFKNAITFLQEGDEKTYDFLQGFKALYPNIGGGEILDPTQFKQNINHITEQELESLGKQFVRYVLDNPNGTLFFLFSLAKFE
jgi:hypothetical protein